MITSIGDGKFLPKEVGVGAESEEFVQIVSGLKENENIVTSGQFLIDSESNLREAINKMLEAKKASNKKESPVHEEKETGKSVAKEKNLRHKVIITNTQKEMMSELIYEYTKIHEALASDTLTGVKKSSDSISNLIKKINGTTPDKSLMKIIHPVKESLKGFYSNDIRKARDSFITMSRPVVKYIKNTDPKRAVKEGLFIYFCPMKEESWLQRGVEIRNPYFGSEMLDCGVVEVQ